MRPGHLHGYQTFVPKAFGLGGGKSDYEPPPGAPTPGAPGSQGEIRILPYAYNKETKKFYGSGHHLEKKVVL